MLYVFDVLKHLPNLITLIIPYNSTDDLLEWISKYNPKLKVLDVSGESDITEDGIESLANSLARDILTIVDIGMPGQENIAHEDISILLMNLPNLRTLKSYCYVGRALRYIIREKDPDFKCKLRYLHDTKTSDCTLDAIVKSCPNLEGLYLESPDRGILHRINEMKLRSFKLQRFECTELYSVLNAIGKYLEHLTLITGRGTMEIGKIIIACPELLDLEFYTMDMLSYTSDKCFSRLRGLQMLSSPLQVWSLKYLICNTPTLQKLAVDTVDLNDEDMS